MTAASRALVLTTYLLVADGLVALYLGDLLGPLGLSLVGAGVVASLAQARLRAPLARVRGGATVPGVIAAVASVVDLVYVASSVLDGLIHLLLFLLLYRLFTRETLRDARDVGFVCFFMLVAAAPGTFDVGFLFVFVAFLFAGTAALVLRHVVAETGPDAGGVTVTGAPRIQGRHVVSLVALASLGTLAISATFFFVIPRIGQAALPLRTKVGRMVSGFSERVSLGAFGEIETDGAVVMRVQVPEAVRSPELLPGLRWRGIVLDRFDGRVWTRDDPDRYILHKNADGVFDLGRPRGGLLLQQEIFLEPLGTDVVFGAPRMLRLAVRAPAVTVDTAGSVAVAAPAARLAYVVESELESPRPRRGALRPALDGAARARYLQLPPLAPRVTALAREAAGDAADPAEVAQRLTRHLSTAYRYTRALPRTTGLPPVEEFLFVSRAGNCEYFAASLAVMLRSLGIPARVVNGFQRGEWNPYGRYFMVRLLDAHSWVEAHVGDAGWTTLDPSPRGPAAAATGPGPVNLYLDALRMRWYRYVVNWSFADQVEAASGVGRAAQSWSSPLDWRPTLRPGTLAGLVAVAAAIALTWLLARRGRVSARRPAYAVPRFYARALRALSRRGLVPAPGETAREFARRAGAAAPPVVAPLTTLTEAYERARFGGVALAPVELAALARCVDALAASRRA